MPTDREYDLSIAGLDMNGHGPPSPRRGHDPRDGVAETTLGVGDFDYDFEGCSRAVPGAVGGYGPREETRALDAMATACEVVDAAENADAAMEATRQTEPLRLWRLSWDGAHYRLCTEPADWAAAVAPPDRLMVEARAMATCLRAAVAVEYREIDRMGWALWTYAQPIETCRGGAA